MVSEPVNEPVSETQSAVNSIKNVLAELQSVNAANNEVNAATDQAVEEQPVHEEVAEFVEPVQEVVAETVNVPVQEVSVETVSEQVQAEVIETVETVSESAQEEAVEVTEAVETVSESVQEDIVDSEELAVVAEVTEETNEELAEDEEPAKKKGFFARLMQGLTKTRDNIVAGMDELFSSDDKIDDDFYDELEEILILGDIGVHTTENILEKLKKQVKEQHIKKRTACKALLIENIKEEMAVEETAYKFEVEQSIVFVIGVNGVGKTTSIGKLASHLKSQGKRVMLVAADTFRAAAGSQLEEWSHRAGVEMIGGKAGQDPASVLYDGVEAAKARKVDVLLVDTAGRLHNKKNLMEELKKMNRIIDKSFPDAHRENLIVLDASTGQNALNQAKEFGEGADLTGIILTKMDGTAKGGIAIAISSELNIPVKYIGVGEKIEDLQKFNSEDFVNALFAVNLDEDEAALLEADGEDNDNEEDND